MESIIFVPPTVKSALCRILQKLDDKFSKLHNLGRIKFVERGGSKLVDILGTKNPWENTHCKRTECWPCQDPKTAGRCRYEGIVYTISCDTCQENGILSQYTGESSRSLFQRSQEHKKAYSDHHEDSPMWKHCSSMHLGVEQTFTIKLLKKHKSAFERQVHESVLITFGKVDFILNSKREWSGKSLPRLTLEVQDKVEQVDHDGTKLGPAIAGHKRTNNQATATNQVTTSCAKRS